MLQSCLYSLNDGIRQTSLPSALERSAETDPPADREENMLTVKAIEVYKFRLDHHH